MLLITLNSTPCSLLNMIAECNSPDDLEAMEVASDLAKASCFVSLQGVFFCSRQSSSAVADATEVSPLDMARTLVVGLYDMSPKLLSEPMSNSALFQIASVVVAVPLM